MSAPRVVRVRQDGEVYHPVMAGARMLDMAELTRLAELRAEPRAASQWLRFILLDESQPRHDLPSFNVAGGAFSVAPACGVHFCDSDLPVAALEDVERHAPGDGCGAEGDHLVGIARFRNSPLADLAAAAVQANIFDGVCATVSRWTLDGGRYASGEIVRISLGDLASSGLATARILDWWADS